MHVQGVSNWQEDVSAWKSLCWVATLVMNKSFFD